MTCTGKENKYKYKTDWYGISLELLFIHTLPVPLRERSMFCVLQCR